MLKRKLTYEQYKKMRSPDLTNVAFFRKAGKRIYGRVSLIDLKSNHVLLGIEPFKRYKPKPETV